MCDFFGLQVRPTADFVYRVIPQETPLIMQELRLDDRKYGLVPKSKAGGWGPKQIQDAFASKRIDVTRIYQDKSAWYIAFSDSATAQRAVQVKDDLLDPNTKMRLPCEIHEAPSEEEIKSVKGEDEGRQRCEEQLQDVEAVASNSSEDADHPALWSERQLEENLIAPATAELESRARGDMLNRYVLKQMPALFKSNAIGRIVKPRLPSPQPLPQSRLSSEIAKAEEDAHLPSFDRARSHSQDLAVVEDETRSPRCESAEATSESLSSVPDISSSPNSTGSSEDSLEGLHTTEDGDAALLDDNGTGEGGTISPFAPADSFRDSVSDDENGYDTKQNERKNAAEERIASAGRSSYRNEMTSTNWQTPMESNNPLAAQRSLKQLRLVDDDEDYYFLKVAVEKVRNEEPIESDADWDSRDSQDSDDSDEEAPHGKGSARTEAVAKIPARQKALHVADRNQAVIDTSMAAALSSARDNRADSRRLVANLEQHKKDAAAETDILKFNQLRTRKKQLKFAKSPIHDWGLYAMELIPRGDMVIEYVGEVIRQQIADEREKKNELNGNFSTYLFRVDDDVVVDATRKGNIARLMNVSLAFLSVKLRYWLI